MDDAQIQRRLGIVLLKDVAAKVVLLGWRCLPDGRDWAGWFTGDVLWLVLLVLLVLLCELRKEGSRSVLTGKPQDYRSRDEQG